jgi:hypothetical protein
MFVLDHNFYAVIPETNVIEPIAEGIAGLAYGLV